MADCVRNSALGPLAKYPTTPWNDVHVVLGSTTFQERRVKPKLVNVNFPKVSR